MHAARAVRRAENGRKAYGTVRPRAVTWFCRARAPLAVILWIAAREGRLVWQDAAGFALLEPPLVQRERGGGLLVSALRTADRRWDILALAVPPLTLLALALALLPFEAYLVALVLALTAMVYVTGMMAGLPLRQGVALLRAFLGRQTAEENAVGNLPYEHWWMPLCHQDVPARVDGFTDQIRQRLSRLIIWQVESAARKLGARPGRPQVTEILVCLLDGATSPAVRKAIVAATTAPATEKIAFMAGSGAAEQPERKVLESGGFLPLYVLGVILVILAEAVLVPGWELDACRPNECAGRPTDYLSAVRWLFQRLLLTDPDGLSPLSSQAWTIGWLTSVMGVMLVPVAVVATRQLVRAQRRENDEFARRHAVTQHTKVLVMVATRGEHDAVLQAVTAASSTEPEDWHLDYHTVFKLGVVGSAEVFLCRSAPGALAPGGSTLTAQSLIDQVRPDYLILTGIGYGLKEEEQKLCDIMVATQLRVMDHKSVRDAEEDGAPPVEFLRGDRAAPSVTLTGRADAAVTGWTGPDVHFGPVLAMNTLLNSEVVRKRLKQTEPDAIGGEMEGGGVYAAAAKGKVDWILIKAISDWGVKKNDRSQKKAAKAAAEFVVRMIRSGGLNEPPPR